MLMKRILSALILVPLLLLSIFYASPWFWMELSLLVTFLVARECWLLIPLNTYLTKLAFCVLLLLSLWLCAWAFPYWQTVGLVLWLLIYCALITFPKTQIYWGHPLIVAVAFLILWPLFTQSLSHVYFQAQGKELLVYLLFLVWAADTGAYFAGKYWGAHKLIPQVSPGKTWEGVLGGFILGMIVAAVGYIYFMPYSLSIWFVVAINTLISSVFGDLSISMFKRRCNLKDTGTIIPGHGGILDRLDSLMAAAPVFYLGLTYLPLGI